MSDIIIVKADPKLKSQAQKIASELGLSLSAVIKKQLEDFVENKSVSFSTKSAKKTPYGIFKGVDISEEDIDKITNSWEDSIK